MSSAATNPALTLLSLATAYQASHTLFATARLRLADHIHRGHGTTAALAEATGTDPATLSRLLRALAAMGVVAIDGEALELTDIGQGLRNDHPGSMLGMVLMHGHADFQRSWASLDDCLRSGEPAAAGGSSWIDRYGADTGLGGAFNQGMSAVAPILAQAILDHVDLTADRHVVDIGGGHGALLGHLLRAEPRLHGTLFDLPEVAGEAAARLAELVTAGRAQALGGDMFSTVPAARDVYLLSRILHDWDDEAAIRILRRCREAMAPSARLIVVERVLPGTPTATPHATANTLADLHMLVRTGGQERSLPQFQRLFAEAGLELEHAASTSLPWSILTIKPALPAPST
jgi:hypothetical protein